MENLKKMKECLMAKVEGQVYGNIEAVSAEELGAAIDMIKDLAEAEYYCAIVKSMEEAAEEDEEGKKGGKEPRYYSSRVMPYESYPVAYYDPRYRERSDYDIMYADGSNGRGGNGGSSRGGNGGRSSGGNNARGGGSRGYSEGNYTMYDDGSSNYSMYHDGMMYPDYMPPVYREGMMKDPREGRSGMRRKMYMEGKGMKDKTKQMQELESYMQELAMDMTEMIQDASPEEKQLLQSKISALAAKVK